MRKFIVLPFMVIMIFVSCSSKIIEHKQGDIIVYIVLFHDEDAADSTFMLLKSDLSTVLTDYERGSNLNRTSFL